MTICSRCGTPLQEGARFCTRCGAKAHSAVFPAPPQASRPVYDVSERPRPAFGSESSPPRPAAPSYRPQSGSSRYTHPVRKPPLRHGGGLRFLSFLFALGLLAVFLGLACTIYSGRYVDRSVEAYRKTEHIDTALTPARKQEDREFLHALAAGDAEAALTAARKYTDLHSGAAALIREDAAYYTEAISRAAGIQFRARWNILQLAAYADKIMLAGGGLACLSLLLWLAMGGRPYNMNRSALTPLLTTFIIWGVLLVLLALVIPAVDLTELSLTNLAPSAAPSPVIPTPIPESIPESTPELTLPPISL